MAPAGMGRTRFHQFNLHVGYIYQRSDSVALRELHMRLQHIGVATWLLDCPVTVRSVRTTLASKFRRRVDVGGGVHFLQHP